MMEREASLTFVSDSEDVARLLFSPLFICDGILSQKAFTLDKTVNETYISVLRPAISSFRSDIEGIKIRQYTLWLCPAECQQSTSYHYRLSRTDITRCITS